MDSFITHVFIINPASGKGNVREVVSAINAICKDKLNYIIKFTSYVGDAERIARECATIGNCFLYSVGGDGTLNEVLNGAAKAYQKANTNIKIGVIPTGTGNDFFRTLSDNKDDIIYRTIYGDIGEYDCYKVNDRYGINIASFAGFDAQVVANLPLMKKLKIFPNVYMAAIMFTLLNYKKPYVRIEFDGEVIEQQLTLLALCNGRYYGNNIQIAPRANPHDGMFDVYLADVINRFMFPYFISKVKNDEHEQYPFVHLYNTKKMSISSISPEVPICCNYDGELMIADKFNICMAEPIKILIPKKNH